MSRVLPTTSGWLRGAFCVLASTLALFACSAVAIAEGATYHYCSGCLIRTYTLVEASQAKYITQNYAHRLAGPAGVTIAAAAQYADNYAWGNYVYSTTTEVTHSYTGTRPAWGAAANFGSGNYSFNAHVTY